MIMDTLRKILVLSSLAALASIKSLEILAALIGIDKQDEVKQTLKKLNDEYNKVFKPE